MNRKQNLWGKFMTADWENVIKNPGNYRGGNDLELFQNMMDTAIDRGLNPELIWECQKAYKAIFGENYYYQIHSKIHWRRCP